MIRWQFEHKMARASSVVVIDSVAADSGIK
jgi:hypothetical protein